MNRTVCDVCGKKFKFRNKILYILRSHLGDLSGVECCGVEYVPTLLSQIAFHVLLFASLIFAFYFNRPAFFGILLAWCAVLLFITPLFLRFRARRRYTAADSFMKRVFFKTSWGALLGYIFIALVLDITNYRRFHDIVSSNTFILVSAVGLAVVILLALVIAVVRVLTENRKVSSDRG